MLELSRAMLHPPRAAPALPAAAKVSHSPSTFPVTMPFNKPLTLALLLGSGAASYLLASLDPGLADLGLRRSLSNGSLYGLRDAEEFAQFQDSADVDRSIEERAQRAAGERCDRLLLYLPDPFADHGHGSQINTYLMGVTTATYLDRAMVLVEPPVEASKYPGGSQFGCPVDAFRETVTQTSLRKAATWEVKEGFPRGFSRLVDHPNWLSRGCPVPCAETHSYRDWAGLANKYHGGEFAEVTCNNPDGSETNVVVTGGAKLRQHFREHESIMVRGHPSPQAHQWATNLGATPDEAKLFSSLLSSTQIWDYVLGLMNKAGFLRLQPWLARDVELFLRSFDLPLGEDYSAIHVRRGDKLAVEARAEVVKFWRSQGHTDADNLPTEYVPFAHYLSKWDGPETCQRDANGEAIVQKHNVYVATDDPIVVHQEIAALPDHIDDDTILHNECHQLRFYFNPTDASAFHLNGDGEKGFEDQSEAREDSCFSRYQRNVASVADMMILSKAKTFIGEYNSNWGRVIRTMRVRLNPLEATSDSDRGEETKVMQVEEATRTLDTRIAWGSTRPRTPGY
ncbi:hypothetical protein ACHAXT_010606 [Thalassiosira profunda]